MGREDVRARLAPRVAVRAQRRSSTHWVLAVVAAAVATPVVAQTVPPPAAIGNAFTVPSHGATSDETAKGHGSISIGYQNTYINGMFLPVPGGEAPIGSVRVQSLSFDLDYFFADRWSAHLGIPFIESRYSGDSPHCITTAPPQCRGAAVPAQPHPESQFLDDGSYHGTWQDWNIGLAYHWNAGDYLITPSITAYVPSHHYTFFAQAAPGQDLRKLEVAIDLAHQFELSNVYYRVRLGRVFAEKTLGQSINHNKLDLELGYFLNDAWTVKAFAVGKKGDGYTGDYDPTTELWYHHDQRAQHNYANLGAGFDYHLNDKYTLSATIQRLVWGQFVFDFKYSVDVRLTREF
jgi:hypothetical protein